MDAAEIAAKTIIEGFAKQDLSEKFLGNYQKRCYNKFGRDFYISFYLAKFFRRYPIILDAIVSVAQRRGTDFLSEYFCALDGTRSKTWFLRPEIGGTIMIECCRLWLKKKIWGKDKK